jgi:hypothetical protein
MLIYFAAIDNGGVAYDFLNKKKPGNAGLFLK